MGDCCNEEIVQGSYGAVIHELTNVLSNLTQYLQSSWSHFQERTKLDHTDEIIKIKSISLN